MDTVFRGCDRHRGAVRALRPLDGRTLDGYLVAGHFEGLDDPTPLLPNIEKILRQRVNTLEDIPRESLPGDLKERAHAAVRELLGHIKVVEDGDQVVAEVGLGRMVYNVGAQERT